MKSQIAILMGVIILVADIYWTATSYFDLLWLTLGVVIFVADIVWLAIDFGLMRESPKPAPAPKSAPSSQTSS